MRKLKTAVFTAMALSFVIGTTSSLAEEKSNPTMNDQNFLVMGHRGVSGLAPEHTTVAYDLVKEQKGDYIEIDLQMTKDGKLVAMHDSTVDRTTDGTGEVGEKTLEEMKQLDAGSWFNEKYPELAQDSYKGLTVQTLEEVFQRYGKSANYYIETKSPDVYPGMEEQLLNILQEYQLIGHNDSKGKVIIQSFSQESLLKVHKLKPEIPLVQLLWYQPDSTGSMVEETGLTSSPDHITIEELNTIDQYAVGIGMNYRYQENVFIDKEFVDKARSLNLLVHPYTVNTEEDMEMLLDFGVTGMFTNFTAKLVDVYHNYKKHHGMNQ